MVNLENELAERKELKELAIKELKGLGARKVAASEVTKYMDSALRDYRSILLMRMAEIKLEVMTKKKGW